jgi:hypothetical protein
MWHGLDGLPILSLNFDCLGSVLALLKVISPYPNGDWGTNETIKEYDSADWEIACFETAFMSDCK